MKKYLSIILLLSSLVFVGCNNSSREKETSNETNMKSKEEIVETIETERESNIDSKDQTQNKIVTESPTDNFVINDDKDREVTAISNLDNRVITLEYKAKGDKIYFLGQKEMIDLSSLNLKDVEDEKAKAYIKEVEKLSNKYSRHDETIFTGNVNTKEVKTDLKINLINDESYKKLVDDNLIVDQKSGLNYMSLTEEVKRLKEFNYDIEGLDDVIDKIKGSPKFSRNSSESSYLPTEKLNENHLASAYIYQNNFHETLFYFGQENNVNQIIQHRIFNKSQFSKEQIDNIKKEFDSIIFPDNLKEYLRKEKEENDDFLQLRYGYLIPNKKVLDDLIESKILTVDINNPEYIRLDSTLNNLENFGYTIKKY